MFVTVGKQMASCLVETCSKAYTCLGQSKIVFVQQRGSNLFPTRINECFMRADVIYIKKTSRIRFRWYWIYKEDGWLKATSLTEILISLNWSLKSSLTRKPSKKTASACVFHGKS